MGFATFRLIISGCCWAAVFGSTSPKIKTKIVMTTVATTGPLAPKSCVKNTVATAEEAMFTILFPIKILEITSWGFSKSFKTVMLFLSPSVARWRRRI